MKSLKIMSNWPAMAGLIVWLSITGISASYAATPEEWPREINTPEATIIIYQPAPESLNAGVLKEMIPVSVIDIKTDRQMKGDVYIEALVSADRENRVVDLLNVKVTKINLIGSLKDVKATKLKNLLAREIPGSDLRLPLEDLTSTLPYNNTSPELSQGLNNNPPEILFTDHPAFLILFDGEPQFHSVNGSELMKAVNTPYFIAQDPKTGKNYLSVGGYWYKTRNLLKDSWTSISRPPKKVRDFQEMVIRSNGETGSQLNAMASNSGNGNYNEDNNEMVPDVIVRTAPAELIQSDGDPVYTPIKGTSLMYMSNTNSNVFINSDDHNFYVLLSGRWYTSPSLDGPWTWVASDSLPADFARIPEGSPKDNVLASVAGTKEAKAAVIESQIPTIATVNKAASTTQVIYNGEPQFAPVSKTSLYRAVNTRSTVLKYNNTYYALDNAVWYSSSSPTGPWTAATEIPAEINKIPPESPDYNTQFVKIYGQNGDLLYEGYTPGYLGWYLDYPTLVYGTGWAYNGWWGPYYYPWPWTWGFGWQFSPWSGWAMDFGIGYWDPFYYYDWAWYNPIWYSGWYWGPYYYHPSFFADCDHYYGGGPVYLRNSRIPYYQAYASDRMLRPANLYASKSSAGVQSVNRPVARPVLRQPQFAGINRTQYSNLSHINNQSVSPIQRSFIRNHAPIEQKSIRSFDPASRGTFNRNTISSHSGNYEMPHNMAVTRAPIPNGAFAEHHSFSGGGSYYPGMGNRESRDDRR